MAKQKETRERYEQHAFSFDGVQKPPRRLYTTEDIIRLHEALEPFLDLSDLRHAIAESRDVYEALRCDRPPKELRVLLDTLVAVLTPVAREQIRSPADVAGMMMLQLGALDHEEFWAVLLDTKNRVIATTQIYKGALDRAMIRTGKCLRRLLRGTRRRLWAAIITPRRIVRPVLRTYW
jgi:hypothetical protein